MWHDLGTISHFYDRFTVMYFGNVVEAETAEPVLTDLWHKNRRARLAQPPGLWPMRQWDRRKP